jgi:S1-C subfamily serine protease
MKSDVVIAYGGRQVDDSGTLRNEVATTAPGREVKLTLVRNGKREELYVRIESLDQSIRLLETAVRERLGATVREASANDMRRYGLEDRQGVVLTAVDARGPLATVGFEIDDIIFGIDNQPFDSLEAFAEQVSGLKKNQKVTLFALDHRSGNMGRAQVTVR